MMKKIALLMLSAVLTFSMAGCKKTTETEPDASSKENRQEITQDLVGNEITLPESTDKIVSLSSSCTDIIAALGLSENLIAIDKYSAELEGVPEDLLQFDLMNPDTEQLIALDADIIFVTSMSNAGGDDIFKPVRDAGACVVAIPSAASIKEIEESIDFIGDIVGKETEAEDVISEMNSEIDEIKQISEKITDKKKVYFEIGAEPKLYTFGTDTFLHEMLTIVGAENIFADQSGWLTVSEEAVVNADPDVILTNVGYSQTPVEDVLNRKSFSSIKAVKDKQVYYIDKNASSLSSQNITTALEQMAEAVYPELYKE